ncbi:MAG: serine-type D-Ala-D-Ala carboxypeptidase [Gammaproteobacteria bacterium]|nr:serine-type D-Ala-D-Ala carboxypeptidase [Gammaproteobacteria bacterium]NIM73688.1 serine-type D-Ala-D-Ala carboxypeptidase [Gammaproteobacteria bacterium]NIN37362.1 serine-type D-Ala-D-Ala carboxypeptidase [Gammaproteobacteria bacterium]NIO25521.1 serine-type D-Ala-D-Ala carboxypeptidase [Gammaproteobacteria bacterium]NIO66196.1 serine-type D-Ala-D-Ala carboxypeptidase [Gammaproteobacteria bacterium]
MSSILLSLASLVLVPALQAAVVTPTPPAIEARAYILQDYDSGEVLVEVNADERMEPASLTKMMTVYVVLGELAAGKFSMEDRVHISKKAWKMGGSKMFIEVGKEVPVEDLLKGVIIQSGNDASVALAEYVAGDEKAFADLMNQYARQLGLANTNFVNASGLPHPEHYTTARDMAQMAVALIRDFPVEYPLHAVRSYTWNDIKQYNRNPLLRIDESVDGVKTGHTESAGYCLVASSTQGDMRLVSALLGSKSEESRLSETQALLRFGFRFFETDRLYAGGSPITQVRVWQGASEQLQTGIEDDLYLTVPRGRFDKLATGIVVDEQILAPVRAGQRLGVVNVKLDGEVIAERPLVALGEVPRGGLWRRMSDSVKLWLQ